MRAEPALLSLLTKADWFTGARANAWALLPGSTTISELQHEKAAGRPVPAGLQVDPPSAVICTVFPPVSAYSTEAFWGDAATSFAPILVGSGIQLAPPLTVL